MSIMVNSQEVEWKKNETVDQLLKRMNYIFPLVVVKINDELIPRKKFSEVTVPDNATVSIRHMTSGG